MEARLRKHEWSVRPISVADATPFVREHHYAMGASKTAVHVHGLFPAGADTLMGVAWWLPSTKVACESVDQLRWREVLSLSLSRVWQWRHRCRKTPAHFFWVKLFDTFVETPAGHGYSPTLTSLKGTRAGYTEPATGPTSVAQVRTRVGRTYSAGKLLHKQLRLAPSPR
jgi:hypothetical protein